MKRTSFAAMQCSIARTLDVIGEWWTPLILREVFFGRRRFEEIHSALGIARNILTDRLTTLVDRGVLERRPYQQRPERHEYHLTEAGVELFPVLVTLLQWGDRHLPAGDPSVVLIHRACGEQADAHLVCSHCGGEVDASTVRAERARGRAPASS